VIRRIEVSDALDIKNKIKVFIINYFVKESGIELNDETSFLDEGIIDSTGVMELVAFLEETFAIKLEDDEIIPDNFDSINKLIQFVQRKLAGKE
jgi:acyl carrier protein